MLLHEEGNFNEIASLKSCTVESSFFELLEDTGAPVSEKQANEKVQSDFHRDF
ncbi:hypothetical protein NC797_01760 [Aquibacillus sp. 3ASR75-11]|uniref:Uncharacterized protein n=1 Tax=Terrihalobacillus insolitus TaxID=2950438 RepID=A0A9X4AM74_9BACI|nr:hypothetical protein [Terrihalobacillus insolitus]MDC3412074.1 hypothetical protein [Terrihalobacillus insolitus]MDC3423233.1 hypothetical protein [Terrihalobacillus insolitus]